MFLRKLFDHISRKWRPSTSSTCGTSRAPPSSCSNKTGTFVLAPGLFLQIDDVNMEPHARGNLLDETNILALVLAIGSNKGLDHDVLQTVGIAVAVTVVGEEDDIVISVGEGIFVREDKDVALLEKADDEFSVSKVHG